MSDFEGLVLAGEIRLDPTKSEPNAIVFSGRAGDVVIDCNEARRAQNSLNNAPGISGMMAANAVGLNSIKISNVFCTTPTPDHARTPLESVSVGAMFDGDSSTGMRATFVNADGSVVRVPCSEIEGALFYAAPMAREKEKGQLSNIGDYKAKRYCANEFLFHPTKKAKRFDRVETDGQGNHISSLFLSRGNLMASRRFLWPAPRLGIL